MILIPDKISFLTKRFLIIEGFSYYAFFVLRYFYSVYYSEISLRSSNGFSLAFGYNIDEFWTIEFTIGKICIVA